MRVEPAVWNPQPHPALGCCEPLEWPHLLRVEYLYSCAQNVHLKGTSQFISLDILFPDIREYLIGSAQIKFPRLTQKYLGNVVIGNELDY